jgi:glutathione-regulated potassium-efflux system ancillary protein KefG
VPNILILFAHPALEKSRVNRHLVEAVCELEGVTFIDLYDAYPEFDVDVRREQELLLAHEIFVLQHPFYWYSTPALFKQWQDLVLEHGWAYGSEGTALHGKMALSVITTGGKEEAYQSDGHNRFTMKQLLAPIQQTANLCGVEYLPPFLVHGTHSLTLEQIAAHASDYRRVIEALRDGTLDIEKARRQPRLNLDIDEIVRSDLETA